MIVMKFGGSSLGDAERIHQVGRIISGKAEEEETLVVVSAMEGVTDQLETCARLSLEGDGGREELIEEIRSRHESAAEQLLEEGAGKAKRQIGNKLNRLGDICDSIATLGELTLQTKDLILSLGEQFSALLLSQHLKEEGYSSSSVNGSEVIVTDQRFGSAKPLMDKTKEKIRSVLPPKIRAGEIPIVTGFIAATEEGKPSTLGRGGSDYTATLLGGMLDADAVWIWTDVDGVKRADPDIVTNATTLPRLTYEEAAELSYFGAQVIHPKSIDPVAKKQVPLVIKNTQNPEGPDTTILDGGKPSTGLKSVTSISDLTLITVKGHGMIGVPGIAAEVFTAVAEAEVNVLMISQSSSEQNITFLVERSSAPKAIESLEESLEEEIRRSIIRDIVTEEPVSIVAAVGSGLSHQTGIDSGVFGSLARHGVNLLSIAQGSSDHNISVVVANQDERVAVQSIYEWIQSENQQS